MFKAEMKSGMALLLTASMLMGLSLSAVDSISIHAETDNTPSVAAYADKDTLADDTFTPKYDDEGKFTGTKGKLKFGKNEDGSAQEWYILGGDKGVNEGKDNTVIFADSNMIYYQSDTKPSVMFENDYNTDKDCTSDMGAYEEGTGAPTNVSPNHYGASDIRQVLQQIVDEKAIDDSVTNISADRYASNGKSKLFSKAELDLLQATEVRTDDFRGKKKNAYLDEPNYYTTSDKLYLGAWDYNGKKASYPWADGQDDTKFYVGSEKGKKILAMDAYWPKPASGDYYWFWLRSPYSGSYAYSLIADPGVVSNSYGVGYSKVNFFSIGVRPASNLNLSNVLFASAAPAATSTTAVGGIISTCDELDDDGNIVKKQDAMMLRFNGINESIGSVKAYESYKGYIIAQKGSTTSDVALVVQGKSGDVDWYYSRQISGNEEIKVTVDEIAATTGIAAAAIDPYSESCKVWLEIPVEKGSTLAYAVKAERIKHTCTPGDELTPYDDKQHGYKCTDQNCPFKDTKEGFTDLSDHVWGEDNVCTKCEYRQGDHIVTKVDEKAPTSTEVGYREHFECSHCSEWFIYPATLGTLVDKPKSYFEIPATGKKDSSSAGGSSSSVSTGWIKDSKGWKYRNSDGILAKGTTVTDLDGNKVEKILWQKAGNEYYAFGSDGYLVTGWIYDKLEDKWYYCDENMGKLYGWYNEPQDGYWYYLSLSTGEALTGWQSINGKDYYFAAPPAAPTYSFDASTGFWIYSNLNDNRPFGSMYANTVTPDNYTVDASGAWVR